MDEFSRHHGFQRLLFFSDAVFAIAITLLILDVRLPQDARVLDLTEAWPQIMGFIISFFVIGRFWLAHHSLFEGVGGYDDQVLRSNLIFLAAVVFLPFPTMVLSELKASAATVGFYGLSLAAVGLLMMHLTWRARKTALLLLGQTLGGTVRRLVNMGGVTLVFLLTAAAAQVWPDRALLILLLLFPVGPLADGLGRRLGERMDQARRSVRCEAESRDPGVTTP